MSSNVTSTDIAAERIVGYLRLARAPMLGTVLVRRALKGLGSLESLLGATAGRLATIDGIGPQRAEGFSRGLAGNEADCRAELETAWQTGVRVLCQEHPEWPAGLKMIDDPPIVVFARGRLEPADTIAVGIVGARKCTFYGREQAERFGALLAGAGITVISGGARGIDTGAHLGALRSKGRTIVIQGCGLHHCYPPENADLYARIERDDAGAILSELPLHVAPTPDNFPPRNRIIAGMSLGVLVVEATMRSGSLITARLAAADYGREVFALPGRVDSAASAGVHHLIKTGGAHLVENLDDVLNALGDTGTALARAQKKTAEPVEGLFVPPPTATRGPAQAPGAETSVADVPPAGLRFTQVQEKLLAALESDPGDGLAIDELCGRTELPASVVMAELTVLQIRAAVKRIRGSRFARRTEP
jgi:DNA processing protein